MKVDDIKRPSGGIICIILFLGLVFSVLASITFGNADISVDEVYKVIGYEIFKIDSMKSYSEGAIHDVVWLIRFPRVIVALSVGMGLAVCGAVMQAVVDNPLADPYILGVSSGGYLGAALSIILGIGSAFGANATGIMAFIGAMVASFSVLYISRIGGKSNSIKLILSGVAINAVCSAFANFIIYIAQDKGAAAEISYWSMGSFASADWENAFIILPVIIIVTIIIWTQYRSLNMMLMGDDTAITLGTELSKKRAIYMIIASFAVGFSVYAAGMIGFVGLVIPHAVRLVCGTNYRNLIPVSALSGAISLIWADVLCRIILENSEIPIGIIISLVGAPCFIYLMVKKSYATGGVR